MKPNLAKLDAVYVYKFDGSDDVRYSLRTLQNIPHGNVFFAGDRPSWAKNIMHVPRKTRGQNRYRDVDYLLQMICKDPRISDDFILMNDDFFIMQSINELPNWYKGILINDYHKHAKMRNSVYTRSILKTDNFLKQKFNIRVPRAYNCHIPVVMNKAKRLSVSVMLEQYYRRGEMMLPRVIYGNLFAFGGEQHDDIKYMGHDDNFAKGSPFLSTSENSFKVGKIGEYIRSKFPEKSIYEI